MEPTALMDALSAHHVPDFAQRVLIVGCEDGAVARSLRDRRVSEIHAITSGALIADNERAAFDSVLELALPCSDLPFPHGYFDCIVFPKPDPNALTGILAGLAPFLAEDGYMLVAAPNRRYWQGTGAGSDPQDMLERISAAGLLFYGVMSLPGIERLTAEPDADGCLCLGGKTYRIASDYERLELLIANYVFIVAQSNYNPLEHAGKLFDALHPDWAYEVLCLIPGSYLEDPAIGANIFAEKMLCQLAMDKGSVDIAQRLMRFAIAQEAFYRAVALMPLLHMAYQCQAQFWHRIGNDDMAARLLRSVLRVAPDPATRAQLDLFQPSESAAADDAAPTWTAPERTPRILFITHPRPHYGLDVLYDGLCIVLAPENVTEFPWKPSLHGVPPKEMANYPCVFNHPGCAIPIEDLLDRIEHDGFDLVLFGDLERSLDAEAARRIAHAACNVPIFLLDEQDQCNDCRRDMAEFLGVPGFAGLLKREMLIGVDYGPNVYPLPFAYPDGRIPADVSGPRDVDLFWAGHREFGLRRLYLEHIEQMIRRKLDGVYRQEDYVNVLLRSRIGLNIFGCGFDTVRYWELPAHGCMLLAERLPIRIPHNFRDGESAVFFDDTQDLEEKLAYCYNRREESLTIARAGHEHLKRYHTGSARARQALAYIQDALTWMK